MILRINWREMHHLYIGAVMFVGGPVCVVFGMNEMLGFIIAMAGFWLVMDDLYQHWRQVNEPGYQSPVNRLFDWCWAKVFGNWWPFGRLK